MEMSLPAQFWTEKFDNMTNEQLAEYLKTLGQKININKFKKNRRGEKKNNKKI
jgi:hypothetical protein